MIHTTPNSGKFRRLVRRLRPLLGGVPVAVETIAAGLLERLWHVATADAIRGDVGKFDDEELAEMIGWHGEAAPFFALLADERWLDRCPVHRYLIHDWADHAPRHVKANAARLGGILTPVSPPETTLRSAPNDPPDPVRSAPNTIKERTPNLTQPNLTQPETPPSPPEGEPPAEKPKRRADALAMALPALATFPIAIQDEACLAAWQGWLAYKAKIRKPYKTIEGHRAQLAAAAAAGREQFLGALVLAQRREWQGVNLAAYRDLLAEGRINPDGTERLTKPAGPRLFDRDDPRGNIAAANAYLAGELG